MATKDKVVLVDGSAFIYRAFYAIPGNFSTANGLPTNAIYGFATMFKKLFSGRTPKFGAVIFDAPGKTFRDEQYPEYKAHRPSMPEDMRPQLPYIDRLVAANRFPLLRVPGYEADDVIGTLTREAVENGMEVVIVSGDKDFAQLINDDVKMVDTLRDVTYDPELVRKKWGVPPKHIVDMLAIVGDKADNIPGAPGVGQKGASTLLDKYGSLDAIIAHADELKGRQKAAFTEHVDTVKLSQALATIDQKVPLDQTVTDLEVAIPDQVELNALYKELEFYSLLEKSDLSELKDSDERTTNTLTSLEDTKDFAATLTGETLVACYPVIDLPTPVRGSLVGLTFSTDATESTYVPILGPQGLGADALEAFRPFFEDVARPKTTYNFKWLRLALLQHEVQCAGVVFDIMLGSFLANPTKIIPHKVEALAKEYLHRTLPPIKAIVGSGKSEKAFSDVACADVGNYAGLIACAIFEATPLVEAAVDELSLREHLMTVDLPLSVVLGDMERTGILVDPDDLKKMGEEFHRRLEEIQASIHKHAGKVFNINSTKQLSAVLFEDLELPVIKKTKSGYSTNQEVLERLKEKHPIASEILDYRKLAKLINTYTDVLQREVNPTTGRVHATFQQTVGATGRLITTEPDLQRTPIKTPEGKRIRKAFVAPKGQTLISADWSQIELRILAHFSNDEVLVDAFTRGADIHRRTAAELFDKDEDAVTPKERDIAKTINFATIYGQGATALGQILSIPRKEAAKYIEGYFEVYEGVRRWLDDTMAKARGTGYVETLLGRRRFIPELSSNSFMDRQAGERIAANTPIQGTGADICKLAMINIREELDAKSLDARMLLQIHDELVFEAKNADVDAVCALVREQMESVVDLAVPLVVEVGTGSSWAAAH